MAFSYYLPRSDMNFKTQGKFKCFLNDILKSYERGKVINNQEHILVLKDFVENFHSDSEKITSEFDIDNCKFIVGEAEKYRTPCIYITGTGNESSKRSISITKLSVPDARSNFIKCCSFIIKDIKYNEKTKKIKNQQAEGEAKDFELHHKSPKFSQIVDDFILENKLSDKLDSIVSPNGQNLNVPEFIGEYGYLNEKFISYYIALIPNLEYELKRVSG